MNATLLKPIQEEPFFGFLQRTLNTAFFQAYPLAGDASNRRYYRVVVDSESWVLMVWEPFVDDENYPFLSVQEHFLKNGIAVPKIVAKSPAEGLVLLEDLGDLTLERKFWESQRQDLVMPYYEAALDEIARIHYKATDDRTSCTAFKVAFDTEKLLWEMNYGRTHLIEKFSKISVKPAESKTLDSIFLDICQTLDREEKVIAHRDYHSRNVMIKLGHIRVIDFQDARMGAIQYDLVSLLKDSYVDLSDETAEKLIAYYLAKRTEYTGKTVNRAHFDEIYEIQSIQRCFKACGSFSSFMNMRGDDRYLKYIHNTLKRVRKSIALFPKYKAFQDILEGYGLLENDFART